MRAVGRRGGTSKMPSRHHTSRAASCVVLGSATVGFRRRRGEASFSAQASGLDDKQDEGYESAGSGSDPEDEPPPPPVVAAEDAKPAPPPAKTTGARAESRSVLLQEDGTSSPTLQESQSKRRSCGRETGRRRRHAYVVVRRRTRRGRGRRVLRLRAPLHLYGLATVSRVVTRPPVLRGDAFAKSFMRNGRRQPLRAFDHYRATKGRAGAGFQKQGRVAFEASGQTTSARLHFCQGASRGVELVVGHAGHSRMSDVEGAVRVRFAETLRL